uniref:Putative tail fiber protein n=2 Tax=viral metagenome TaxID=1070528 RepID=A0A6M3JFF9_9ZZZZ
MSMYATWNPADKDANCTLSGGNLVVSKAGGSYVGVRATISKTAGKWYFEITTPGYLAGYRSVGVGTAAEALTGIIGGTVEGWGHLDSGIKYHTGSGGAWGANWSDADVIGVAVDLDVGKIWISVNGSWYGDPVAGTGEMYSGLSGTLFPMTSLSGGTSTVNFGASAFAYAVPSGFNPGWYTPIEGELDEDASVNFATDADVRLWRYTDEEVSVNASFLDNMGLIDEEVTADDSFLDNLPELSEDASANETFGATGTFNTNLYEETGIHTEMRGTGSYVETINDGFASTDVSTAGFVYAITCDESLVNTDTTVCAASFSVLDGFMIYDNAQPNWHKSVPESLVLTDTIFKILGIPCPDSLTLNDSIVTGWKGQEIVNEILGCYELAIGILQFSKTIDDTMDAADTVTYRLAVTVLENILFTSLATAVATFQKVVADGAAITDEAARGFDKSINESLVNTDTVSVITSFFNAIAESLVGTDAASMVSSFYKSINDGFAIVDTVASKGTLYNIVSESLGLLDTVEFAGETWETYVLNTPKFYPSQYSGFNFNSYAVFENRAFGANDVGIYELTGETDAGETIHTGVVLNSTDFGSANQKRFRRAYLDISGTAPKMIFECEDGRREAYDIDTQGKTVASSELKSKSWKLSISDFDELDSLKLIPVVLTK